MSKNHDIDKIFAIESHWLQNIAAAAALLEGSQSIIDRREGDALRKLLASATPVATPQPLTRQTCAYCAVAIDGEPQPTEKHMRAAQDWLRSMQSTPESRGHIAAIEEALIAYEVPRVRTVSRTDKDAGAPHDPRTNGSTEPCDAPNGEYACSCGAWHAKDAGGVPLPSRLIVMQHPLESDEKVAQQRIHADGWNSCHAAFMAYIDAREAAGRADAGMQIVGWIHEDELPEGYPYDAMFVHSRVDGVRLFPVYAPAAAVNQPMTTQGEMVDPWATIIAVCEALDIDPQAARFAPGKPSDVILEAARRKFSRGDGGEVVAHIDKDGGSWEITGIPKKIYRMPDGHHRLYLSPSPVADAEALADATCSGQVTFTTGYKHTQDERREKSWSFDAEALRRFASRLTGAQS